MQMMRDYAKQCQVASYHLILDNNNIEYEKQKYLELSDGGLVEIWKMHNWSGVYHSDRKGEERVEGRLVLMRLLGQMGSSPLLSGLRA